MGRPIEIPIDATTGKAEKNLDQVADALEKVADAADDLGTGTKDAGRDAERALDGVGDAAKETAKQADKLDRDLTKALDDVDKTSKRAGDGLGRNVKRGTDEASEGMTDMKENAASNAKEIGASFDGSFDGMVDGLQGFVAESLEGFGAVGIAGGVALAAAIGIGLQALEQSAEKANAITENATELGDSLSQASTHAEAVTVLRDRFEEVANAVGDARSLWEVWQDRARTQGEQLADAIKQGSLNAADLSDAFSDPDPVNRMEALRRVQDQLNDSIAENTDQLQAGTGERRQANEDYNTWAQRQAEVASEIQNTIDVSKEAKGIIDDEIATQEAAVAILEAKAAALGQTVDEYQEVQAKTEAAAATQESYNSAIESAGDAVSVYESVLQRKADAEGTAVEDTKVSVSDMIAEWNRQADEAEAFGNNLTAIAAAGGDALAEELRAQGPEAAAATAELLANASPDEQRQAFESWGKATGQGMGDQMAQGVRGSTGTVQSGVDYLRQGIRTPAPLELGVQLPTQEQLQLELDRKTRALRPGTITLPAVVGVQRAI